MAEELFRKKSLDRIKSPENLNDYVRVVNPSVWLVLAAIILLLLGACIWGIFGQIEAKIPALAMAENGQVVCQVQQEKLLSVQPGMTVRIGETEGTVTSVVPASGEVLAQVEITDGTYQAEVVTERLHPMSFLFN